MTDKSITGYLAIMFIFIFFVACSIIKIYAEPGLPWHSYITIVLGYFAAFSILLIVPIDIATTVYNRRGTHSYIDQNYTDDIDTLSPAYDTFFTIVLILGSFVLVFLEYFNSDGYFTVKGRLKSSVKRLLMDKGPYLVIGVIILGILLGQKVVSDDINALKLSSIIITNTVYEVVLMFLLGYGFIEFPRSWWDMANHEKYLSQIQLKASTQFKDISEAQLNVSLCVSDVLKTKEHIASYPDQELQHAMSILVSECPPEFTSSRIGTVPKTKDGKITIDILAGLRTRLNNLKDIYKMAQAKVEGTKLLAYKMEDIVAAKKNPSAKVIHWSLTDKDSTEAEYNLEIYYKPWRYRFTAFVCAVLSVLSFLGVVCSMKGVSNNVSVYFLAVHDDNIQLGGIVVFILFTLGYVTYITYWSLFQIKFGAANELVPSRTSAESMSYNVRMVCSLASPLAFFYLGWISENGIRTGDWVYNDAAVGKISMPTAFSKFYSLSNIGIVQEVFGTICPIILFVVLGLFALNIFNRLLILLKLDEYQFGAQIITDEQLREGKRLLQRHKKTTERKYKRGELKSFIVTVGNVGGETYWQMFYTSFSRLWATKQTYTPPTEEIDNSLPEPAPLAATLEKKASSGGFSSGSWKEHYVIVRNPGYLHICKDRITADNNTFGIHTTSTDPNIQVYDLKHLIDIRVGDKKKIGSVEIFDMTLSFHDISFKLKFGDFQTLERWKKGLLEWKEYNIDFSNKNPQNSISSLSSVNVETPSPLNSNPTTPLNANNTDSSSFGFSNVPNFGNFLDEKPAKLDGWLEKKGGKGFRGEWQKRYFSIDETKGHLVYWKTNNTSDQPQGSIDIHLIGDIITDVSDPAKFSFDTHEKTYKFKSNNVVDSKRWVDGLNAWKDYFLLNMSKA